jgi:hypothetical protein
MAYGAGGLANSVLTVYSVLRNARTTTMPYGQITQPSGKQAANGFSDGLPMDALDIFAFIVFAVLIAASL